MSNYQGAIIGGGWSTTEHIASQYEGAFTEEEMVQYDSWMTPNTVVGGTCSSIHNWSNPQEKCGHCSHIWARHYAWVKWKKKSKIREFSNDLISLLDKYDLLK